MRWIHVGLKISRAFRGFSCWLIGSKGFKIASIINFIGIRHYERECITKSLG